MQKEEDLLKFPKKYKLGKKNLPCGSFVHPDEGWQELKNPEDDKDDTLNFQNKAI